MEKPPVTSSAPLLPPTPSIPRIRSRRDYLPQKRGRGAFGEKYGVEWGNAIPIPTTWRLWDFDVDERNVLFPFLLVFFFVGLSRKERWSGRAKRMSSEFVVPVARC